MAVGGCGSSTTSEDRPERAARLVLDAPANGVHAGIFSATRRGYDDAEGVDLRVRRARPGAARLVATGRAEFAVLDINDLARARERGQDLVGIMALVQRPLAALLTQPGVRDPRADLAGRRIGATGTAIDDAIVREIAGPRARTVRAGVGAVATGRLPAATGNWSTDGVALRERLPGARVLRLDDFGAPSFPELVLVTSRGLLQDQPGLARATVRALARGYRFTLTDPDSSAQDVVAATRRADAGAIAAQLDALDAALLGPAGAPGVLDPAALRAWSRWAAEQRITRRPPDVERAFEPRYAAQAAGSAEG